MNAHAQPDRDLVLALARALASLYGARLYCLCGRAGIGDDGTCARCAEEDADDSDRRE